MSKTPVIKAHNLQFAWKAQRDHFAIAEFVLQPGEAVFLHGPSGCGKSTFLNLLAGVLIPKAGNLQMLNQSLSALSQHRRDRFRADHIGLIFQQFNLLPYLSVIDNVLLPLTFSPQRKQRLARAGINAADKACELLAHLGLATDLLDQAVSHLSVGQQQRVAAARALLGAPELIIADEPTSALDEGNQQRFVDLLKRECAEQNTALILVSHDQRLAAQFDRAIDFSALCQRHLIAAGAA